MSLSNTSREIVSKWFELFNAGKDADAFDLVADDVYWVAPGSGSTAAQFTKAQLRGFRAAVVNHSIAGKFEILPKGWTVEGERVAVQAECQVPLKNGKLYNNFYHMLFIVRDSKIREVYEYVDTLHGFETLKGIIF
jgi:ketosteroid isomerase-like protein